MSDDGSRSLAVELTDGTHLEPGATCSGSVSLSTERPTTCRSMTLQCRLSSESGLEGEERRLREIDLLEEGRDVEPGEPVRVPFEFELPAGPASYNGELFSVEWSLEAAADLEDGSTIRAEQPIELRATSGIERYRPGHLEAIGAEGAVFERPPVYWPDVYTCLLMVALGLVAVTWVPHLLWFAVALMLIAAGGMFNLYRTLDLEGHRTRWPPDDQSLDGDLTTIGGWFVALGIGVPLLTNAVILFSNTGTFRPVTTLRFSLFYLPFWTRIARFLVVAAGVWILVRTSTNWLTEWLVGEVSVEVEPTEVLPGGAVASRCLLEADRGFELADAAMEVTAFERKRDTRHSGSAGSYNGGGMRVYHTEHREVQAERISLTDAGTTEGDGGGRRRLEATLTLPTDAPYSVQLPGRELRWEVRVELETSRGWTWKYRVPLVVRPPRPTEIEHESSGNYGVEW